MRFITFFLSGSVLLFTLQCDGIRRLILGGYDPGYRVEGPLELKAAFPGLDADRKQVTVSLVPVVSATNQPTDIQFPPGKNDPMIVLEKEGRARWFKQGGSSGVLFSIPVASALEEGLLGMTFHPDFRSNGKFYLNYVISQEGRDISRVAEWIFPDPSDITKGTAKESRIIMEVNQPYQNHKAGQLAFGPDGMLYIGWGDGGWKNDPHGNGQNMKTMLGKMLRVDVNHSSPDKNYSIPRDNPFVGNSCCIAEIFASGLRNPWRYTFDTTGRLIVADVGQDTWEEIDIVGKGSNLGWNIREGFHCFDPSENCRTEGLTDPIFDYPRSEGNSITGGYVYTGTRLSGLRGKYIFGDFVSGRIWALELPERTEEHVKEVYALGKWPVLISTFGRNADGEIFVADFGTGKIYRIDP